MANDDWTYSDHWAHLDLTDDDGHEIGFIEINDLGIAQVELRDFDVDRYHGGLPTPRQMRDAEQGARELLAAALAALGRPADGEG